MTCARQNVHTEHLEHLSSSIIYSVLSHTNTHTLTFQCPHTQVTTAELTTSICKLFIYTVTTLARQNGFHMAIRQNNNNCRERRRFSQQNPALQSENHQPDKTKQDKIQDKPCPQLTLTEYKPSVTICPNKPVENK